MKRIICFLLICVSLMLIVSCAKITNPTAENCYNFRCEITMDDETFTFDTKNAKELYSKCNEYLGKASVSADAIGSGECIKIKFLGDKVEKPKKSSDIVDFGTFYIHSNDIVVYEGKINTTYKFSSGFYKTIDMMIFLKK